MPSWEQKVLCFSVGTPHKGQAMFLRTQRVRRSSADLAAARELSARTGLGCAADGAMRSGAAGRHPGTSPTNGLRGGKRCRGRGGTARGGISGYTHTPPTLTRVRLREAPQSSRPRGARARRSHGDPVRTDKAPGPRKGQPRPCPVCSPRAVLGDGRSADAAQAWHGTALARGGRCLSRAGPSGRWSPPFAAVTGPLPAGSAVRNCREGRLGSSCGGQGGAGRSGAGPGPGPERAERSGAAPARPVPTKAPLSWPRNC